MQPFLIRPIEAAEIPLLEDFLYDAIFQKEGETPLPREVIFTPELHHYIENFGTAYGDICLVAVMDGNIVGAVWTRILADHPKGYGNIDAATPELSISIKADNRGKGMGSALLRAVLQAANAAGFAALSLSVQKENPAYQLYARLGFQVYQENAEDVVMVHGFVS